MKEADDKHGTADRSIPASDFTRRRVARVLQRERPMHDQVDTSRRLFRNLCEMFEEVRGTTGGAIFLKTGPIIAYNLAKKARPCEVIWMGHKPLPYWWRRPAANFHSKFCKLKFSPDDSRASRQSSQARRGRDQDVRHPAEDAARQRVAAILRRERPRRDQDNTSRRMDLTMMKIHENARDAFGAFNMGTPRLVTGYNILGPIRIFEVVWSGNLPIPHTWKRQAPNFQSKFCGFPQLPTEGGSVSRPDRKGRESDQDGPVLPGR